MSSSYGYGVRPSVADWNDGVSASWVQLSVSAGNGWPHNALRTIGSCQSAATSEIVKALLVTSVTHVSGAITSVLTFNFTFQMVPFSMTLSDLYPTFQGDDNIQCQITRLIVNHV